MILFALPIIWCIMCLLFVAYEVAWGPFWVSIVACIIASFFGFNIALMIWATPMLAVKYIAMYCATGLGWSSFKFFVKLRKARRAYVKDKADYIAAGTGSAEQFVKRVKGDYQGTERYAPTVGQNKGNIMFWMWHWPFSVITFLLEDLIREIWNFSWRAIKGLMEGIRKAALGEAARDLD